MEIKKKKNAILAKKNAQANPTLTQKIQYW
jgi:hypothetical protein